MKKIGIISLMLVALFAVLNAQAIRTYELWVSTPGGSADWVNLKWLNMHGAELVEGTHYEILYGQTYIPGANGGYKIRVEFLDYGGLMTPVTTFVDGSYQGQYHSQEYPASNLWISFVFPGTPPWIIPKPTGGE